MARNWLYLLEPNLLQILLGLHDVNDDLGALSLRALADLVPLLGGASVLCPRRRHLFTSAVPNVSAAFEASGVQLFNISLLQAYVSFLTCVCAHVSCAFVLS